MRAATDGRAKAAEHPEFSEKLGRLVQQRFCASHNKGVWLPAQHLF